MGGAHTRWEYDLMCLYLTTFDVFKMGFPVTQW